MIFRKHSTAGLLLATFVATSLSAHAFGLPLVGKKKKTEDVLPARKLTAAQMIADRHAGNIKIIYLPCQSAYVAQTNAYFAQNWGQERCNF